MFYYQPIKNKEGLWLAEEHYNRRYIAKTESAFAQSNGHFGVRAMLELRGIDATPGMFVSGLYQKAQDGEVTELVNCPDVVELGMYIQGESVNLDNVRVEEFQRKLNLYTGELWINILFRTQNGLRFLLRSKRFAADFEKTLFYHKTEVTLLDGNKTTVTFEYGINGQITNSGTSHFQKTECRVYGKEIMAYHGALQDDGLEILTGTCFEKNQEQQDCSYHLKRRSIYAKNSILMEKGDAITLFRISHIQEDSAECKDVLEEKLEKIQQQLKRGYEQAIANQKKSMEGFCQRAAIEIDGASLQEKAGIAYAQYQMYGMDPAYTNRYSIGAKGLTGEGYKGHVFWDTELFILPFFVAEFPEAARKLLEYRYRGKAGAKRKAEEYGFQGFMYPWECAKDGFEETPLYAALNIHTGKANKVWSGIKEHHVTADIAFAISRYYYWSNDREFLNQYGTEILCETANFWVSRAEERNGRLEILNIIGPDEYNEHIDNNAYTNYMAAYNVKLALKASEEALDSPYVKKMKENGSLKDMQEKWQYFLEHIYLPKPDKNGIIPQDDAFLGKEELKNIEKYRQSPVKQSVLLDYSRDEVVDMQVLKQADLVMLFTLFPGLFPADVVKKNVLFYEKRTLHDSSLSYCAHAQICAEIGEMEMAEGFFVKALETDLCDNPQDSVDGIHAASLGGIWKCVVAGFAGVSCDEDGIILAPHLLEHWNSIKFSVMVHGQKMDCFIDKENISLHLCNSGKSKEPVTIKVHDKKYILKDDLHLKYGKE